MIPFFGQGDFQTSANMTPQQIERKRALMAVLQPRFGQARYVGEGIGQLATGIAMGAQDRKMDRAEGVNEQGRQSIMDRIFGGVSSQPDMGGTGFSVLGQAPVAERPMVQDDASRIGGGGDMSKYREAIASIESKGSGDYAAIGPTHQKLGRALGRYQVMEANIGPWSRAALGREVTPEEFLANPQIQDAVFDHRFGQYVQRHGPEAAAQAWFAGEGGIGQLGRKDSLGTTVGAYTDKFSRAIGGAGGGQAPTPAQSGPDMSALYQALSSPLLRQEDRALIMSEIQRREQAADPMRAMQLQRAQLEIEQMQNPQSKGVVVGGRIVDPSTGQVIYQPGPGEGSPTEYGLQPQYGVDAEGNPVLIQIGKDGTATQTQLPEGVTFQKEPIRIDGGTEWILLDPITRQPVGRVPKQLREAAAETAIGRIEGEATGAAITGLNSNLAQVDEAVALIDSVMNDPALSGITGMLQGRLPPMTQAGTDLNVKINQIKGKAFLEAFESLKGGGAITNLEGQVATEAMARLDRAQSDAAYREALAELRGVLERGAERARRSAGQPDAAGAAPQANSFEAFAADPSAQAAANRFGVSLEEMWAIKQGLR
jgi:hypothetical protein